MSVKQRNNQKNLKHLAQADVPKPKPPVVVDPHPRVRAEFASTQERYFELTDGRGSKAFRIIKKREPLACPGRVHLSTSRGEWCIPMDTEFRLA